MKRKRNLVVFFIVLTQSVYCQNLDVSVQYGRFWAPYRHRDFGSGFRETPESNYNFFPSITINKYYSKKFSAEFGISLTLYEQYFGTRLYKPAFASTWGAGHLTLSLGHSFIRNNSFELRIKGGPGLGIAPDQYEGKFTEMLVFPIADSISKGSIRRNFTPIFPTLGAGLDFAYKVLSRGLVSLAVTCRKGFVRISEYDIFYNDGNGRNDNRAMQWGTGDFYGVQVGFRYVLNGKEKKIQ